MKKLKVFIKGYFEIIDEKHSVDTLPKSIKEASKKLAKDYEDLINFEIGQSNNGKWNVNYFFADKSLTTAKEVLKIFMNKIEFIFNSKTKEIKRTESIIYG